jgi:hypothetical protein
MASLFLTSSVSGGSVGVYHYTRHLADVEGGRAWIRDTAGVEVLSPIVAWGLFHDLPAFMAGADVDPSRCTDDKRACLRNADRALVQEAAVAGFEDDAVPGEGGSRVLDPREPRAPVTIFNAALDGAEGRVLISPVSLSPPRETGCPTPWTGDPAAGSMDGHDLLNRTRRAVPPTTPRTYTTVEPFSDLPLVTAALLSARFPVVAPAARLGVTEPPAGSRGCETLETLPPQMLRDGGYVENSGLLTVIELIPTIQRAIADWTPPGGGERPHVPIVVLSIDDDPTIANGDPDLSRGSRSSLGISKTSGPGYFTRLARDRLESCQYRGVHYARVSPEPHVGAQAATGWEISETARREDLVAALSDPRRGAGRVLETVRDVIDGGAERCPA